MCRVADHLINAGRCKYLAYILSYYRSFTASKIAALADNNTEEGIVQERRANVIGVKESRL